MTIPSPGKGDAQQAHPTMNSYPGTEQRAGPQAAEATHVADSRNQRFPGYPYAPQAHPTMNSYPGTEQRAGPRAAEATHVAHSRNQRFPGYPYPPLKHGNQLPTTGNNSSPTRIKSSRKRPPQKRTCPHCGREYEGMLWEHKGRDVDCQAIVENKKRKKY